MNALLSRVLFSQRAQFQHKVHALRELIEDLQTDYARALSEILDETSHAGDEASEELEVLHYDMNTCLREAMIVLKSFLHVLPDEELADFQRQAMATSHATAGDRQVHQRDIRPRRLAPIAGK